MKRKTFYWHPPVVYVGLLAGLLPYVILALVLRKSGTIQLGLCQRHKRKRLWNVLAGLITSALSIAVFVIAGQTNDSTISAALVSIGIVMLLAGIVWAALAARTLSPTKIDDRTLWLRGAGDKLLDALPNGPSYAWAAPGAYQPPAYAYPPR